LCHALSVPHPPSLSDHIPESIGISTEQIASIQAQLPANQAICPDGTIRVCLNIDGSDFDSILFVFCVFVFVYIHVCI
jgi:hypothetical protein